MTGTVLDVIDHYLNDPPSPNVVWLHRGKSADPSFFFGGIHVDRDVRHDLWLMSGRRRIGLFFQRP
jgi:hypothetical protein